MANSPKDELVFFRPAPAHELDDDDPADHYSNDFVRHLREVGEQVLTMFNSNWNGPETIHYCGTWCGCLDDEHAVHK